MPRFVIGLGYRSRISADELQAELNTLLGPEKFSIVSLHERGSPIKTTPERIASALHICYPDAEWYIGVEGDDVPLFGVDNPHETEHHEVAYMRQVSLPNQMRQLLEPDELYLTMSNPSLVENLGNGMQKVLLPNGNSVLFLSTFTLEQPRSALNILLSMIGTAEGTADPST